MPFFHRFEIASSPFHFRTAVLVHYYYTFFLFLSFPIDRNVLTARALELSPKMDLARDWSLLYRSVNQFEETKKRGKITAASISWGNQTFTDCSQFVATKRDRTINAAFQKEGKGAHTLLTHAVPMLWCTKTLNGGGIKGREVQLAQREAFGDGFTFCEWPRLKSCLCHSMWCNLDPAFPVWFAGIDELT